MVVYTSVTKSYLPKARVLARSVKKFHPNWTFILLFSDNLPSEFNLKDEPFDEVITIDQLGIPNWKSWAFGHAIVELCTAVKGPAAELIANRNGIDKIMYLDPDIKVFSPLTSLELLLDKHEILLTPHLLVPEGNLQAIKENEISALKHGIYNLGFFAARTTGQGMAFISWWSSRLKYFCEDNIPGGLFTDQRWCDLAPAFFSNLHIVRDIGCNVATWNISHRTLSKRDQLDFYVGDVPLRFYHFTSYDSGAGLAMLERYASNKNVAFELWNDYKKSLASEGQGSQQDKSWHFDKYSNGVTVHRAARRLYRIRKDIQEKFPDPFSIEEPSFFTWWRQEGQFIEKDYNSSVNRIWRTVKSYDSKTALMKHVLRIFQRDGFSGLLKRIFKK